MFNEDLSEMNILYKINKKMYLLEKEYTIKIFGNEFVENNKNNCKMIIENKEYELAKKFNFKNYNKDILEIELKGIENITDMSNMFSGCTSLYSLPNISKWNTNNITNMSYMFSGCTSLYSLPNIIIYHYHKQENL